MNVLEPRTLQCPYCGEPIDVLIDRSESGQRYIEDCQVCCQPILFDLTCDQYGELMVTLYRENDG